MFDKNGRMDGTLLPLFRPFEKTSLEDCDVIITPVTFMNNYQADTEAMTMAILSKKKIVVVDFVEYGWDIINPDHLFSINTTTDWSDKFLGTDYTYLNDFLKVCQERIVLYFKRELPERSKLNPPFKILPIEYPGVNTLPEVINPDTYEEYSNRPIDVIMVWGLSNPSRPILHGEFVKKSALNGQHLVSTIDHVGICQARGDKRMIVMAHVPDFARVSIHQILHLQSLSKISISMNGAGKKCFRHAESSYNSVMALQENELKWSYPWIDEVNSIELPNEDEEPLINEDRSYSRIMYYLGKPESLYKIYLQGINNWKNYEVNNYSNDYVLKEIQHAI